MQCTTTGDDSDPSRVDLFALNSYSWCGDSNYQTSTYNTLTADFGNTSVPVFFSEYGCNVPYPRVFTEVPVLYGPLMTPVLSGGLIYEFSQETSNYGLVNIATNGSAELLADYDTLQKQFNSLNVTMLQGVKAGNTTVVAPACASSLITSSTFSTNFTLPVVPPGAQTLIDNGISNAPVGKLVSVTATTVTQQVRQSNGQLMAGLAIVPLADDASNNPSGASATGSTTTSAAPAATSTKKSSAASIKSSLGMLLGVVSLTIVYGACC